MHYVELMKENFALTCRVAIARQPDTNGGQNKHRKTDCLSAFRRQPPTLAKTACGVYAAGEPYQG